MALSRFLRAIFRLPLPRDDEEADRFVRRTFLLHFHPSRVKPEHLRLRHTWCMGGISALLFGVTVVSGIVLMFYYKPSVGEAHASVRDIESVVTLGPFWRAVHRYASELMIITVFLHMVRVLLNRAYRPPREFNWTVGFVMFLLLLFTAFTGYLLPFDVLSYNAVSVAKGMSDQVPFLGRLLANLLFGGDYIGSEALLRFYVLHCVALPLSMAALMGLHFWRVRRDGYKGGL